MHASVTTRERSGSDSWRTLHTRPTLGHRAPPKAVLPPQCHPPGRRGGPFKAGWSPVPTPRAAPGSDRLSPVWGGEIDRHHLPPQPGSTRTPVRGPGPQPGYPGAGAGVGTPGPAPQPAAPIAAFSTPSAPLVGGGGESRSPHRAHPGPAGRRGAVVAKGGVGGYPSPTWVPRDESAGSAQLRAQLRELSEAPGLAAHVRSASVCLWLSGSGLGAARTLPSRAPPAPPRADVTAPPQPMAAANRGRAARPPRFKSQSRSLRERRVPRFRPVGSRRAPAWLRSGLDRFTWGLGVRGATPFGGLARAPPAAPPGSERRRDPITPAPPTPSQCRKRRKPPGSAPLRAGILSLPDSSWRQGGEGSAPRPGPGWAFGRLGPGDLSLIVPLSHSRAPSPPSVRPN